MRRFVPTWENTVFSATGQEKFRKEAQGWWGGHYPPFWPTPKAKSNKANYSRPTFTLHIQLPCTCLRAERKQV